MTTGWLRNRKFPERMLVTNENQTGGMMFATIRNTALGAAVGLSLVVVPKADAGLVGNGTNTVSALFFNGTAVPSPPYTNPPPTEIEGGGPMLIPAHFPIGVEDEATIDVGDTTITITNEASLPFCSNSAAPCSDVFTGFAFSFSAGVDITGVNVDPASAPDFQPAGVSPLELLTPTDIIVNLVGEDPAVGDQLILDVTTAVTPPPSSVPEPASLSVLALGLAGLGMVLRTRRVEGHARLTITPVRRPFRVSPR